MKNRWSNALNDTLYIIGILYLFVILISFFTKNAAIFYNSRIFVLVFALANFG